MLFEVLKHVGAHTDNETKSKKVFDIELPDQGYFSHSYGGRLPPKFNNIRCWCLPKYDTLQNNFQCNNQHLRMCTFVATS